MIIAELTIVPLGTSGTTLSPYVAEAVKEIEDSGLNYQVHATGTVIEAPNVEKVLEITRKAHEAVMKAGAPRVITTLTFDERTDKKEKMEDRAKKVLPK